MKKVVAVLMGGPSSEREISLKSGRTVCEALKDSPYEPIAVDAVDEWLDTLNRLRPSVVFIALHGKFGEDGTVQAILEEAGVPYTGSGVEASRFAMDKIISRKIFQQAGIPVPEYSVLTKPSHDIASGGISFPMVVKPSSQGSSIGLTIAENKAQLDKAIDLAYALDENIMIENFVRGDELTVGILDEESLPVIKIVPNRRFYDYKAKYLSGDTRYLVPAPLGNKFYKKAQGSALSAHKALGLKDFSRVDMILDTDGIMRVLEVNSIPGFTSASLLPRAAASVGIGFKQLCIKIIELALKNAKEKK